MSSQFPVAVKMSNSALGIFRKGTENKTSQSYCAFEEICGNTYKALDDSTMPSHIWNISISYRARLCAFTVPLNIACSL